MTKPVSPAAPQPGTPVGPSAPWAQPLRVHLGVVMVALLAVPGLLLCWRPTLWLGIFTHDPGIAAVGTQYFRIIGPSYPFIGISMVIAFALQGLGKATAPLVWMVVRVVGVLGVSLFCTRWLGMADRAVFTTIAAGNVVSAGVMLILFARIQRGIQSSGLATQRQPAADPIVE